MDEDIASSYVVAGQKEADDHSSKINQCYPTKQFVLLYRPGQNKKKIHLELQEVENVKGTDDKKGSVSTPDLKLYRKAAVIPRIWNWDLLMRQDSGSGDWVSPTDTAVTDHQDLGLDRTKECKTREKHSVLQRILLGKQERDMKNLGVH